MPQMMDPNFARSVVLLIHHDTDGTFGIVLNRPTDLTAPALCSSLEIEWRGDPEGAVDWGGPVQPESGWMLFGHESGMDSLEGVTSVAEGVWFSSSLEVLKELARDCPAQLRVLLGYAGWGPGQLEAELSQGAWLTVPVSQEVVFEVHPDLMWERVVRSLGIDPAALVSSPGVH